MANWRIKLNPQPIDVKSAIEEVIDTIAPLAQAKNLQLQVNCDRAPKEVLTDPFRLQQILTNLLSNAVRYTDEGYLRVECVVQANEKWSFSVTDTGIGIDREDLERIFEPYAQAYGLDRRRDKESTGLGLAIVSRMVKLLQGEIKVFSQKAVGSTFTVTFPLKVKVEGTSVRSTPS
ncbi:MAG TPA: HAMP domain-containing sensor histidine kinase [Leptolyngbyaceae cyanobacterium]